MSEIVERFEKKAIFEDEREAALIREKLERFVANILAEVGKRDKRFQSTLVQSGSVYEGVKVCRPDEFDFMIRIDSLTDKPLFHPCDKGEGYTKLILDEQEWEDFKDEDGFFNPNLLSRFFKKLVNASLSDAELPEGLAIQRVNQALFRETWWPVFSDILGNSDGQESSSGVMYSETHGPATTLYIQWQGGNSYRNLMISVDLTLTFDYQKIKLPVQLTKLPQEMDQVLVKCGFHVVPAGYESWRISFSMAEKDILAASPDGFKACYRVLKVARDEISARLAWDSSLVPSYIFKTILLSELCRTDDPQLWENRFWSQRIVQVLELALEGVKRETLPSFFIPKHNLLTVADHENKLRQCVLEDMLTQMKGLELVHSPNDAREIKQQIRVLQMIDLLDFVISGLLAGKNPTAIWSKMFANLDNVPQSKKTGWFWNQITDLNSIELDANAYRRLIQMWRWVGGFFKKLQATLEGELNLLAHKFYIRLCEKKTKFESENEGLSEHDLDQISPGQVAFEWLEDFINFYTQVDNSTLSNLHKAISPEFTASGFFHDIADVTVQEGSDKGLAVLKQRFKQYLFMVPEDFILAGVADYVGQIILRAKEVLSRKLDYIVIPELDLD